MQIIFFKVLPYLFQNNEHGQVWFNTSATVLQNSRRCPSESPGAQVSGVINKNISLGIKYFLIEMNLDISIQID